MRLNTAQSEESTNSRGGWGEEKNTLFTCHHWEKNYSKVFSFGSLIKVT